MKTDKDVLRAVVTTIGSLVALAVILSKDGDEQHESRAVRLALRCGKEFAKGLEEEIELLSKGE